MSLRDHFEMMETYHCVRGMWCSDWPGLITTPIPGDRDIARFIQSTSTKIGERILCLPVENWVNGFASKAQEPKVDLGPVLTSRAFLKSNVGPSWAKPLSHVHLVRPNFCFLNFSMADVKVGSTLCWILSLRDVDNSQPQKNPEGPSLQAQARHFLVLCCLSSGAT